MSQAPFKILGISSGRPMGNSEILLRECLMECERLASVDVRITRLRTLKIKPCTGCLECLRDAADGGAGICPIQDDFMWLKEQILWADAIVFADPSFCYEPTSEVITMMNRALGSGKDYVSACRAGKKLVALICNGGSDTVDFNLPMQYYAINSMCRGSVLVDQFYANWNRGKGYVAAQEHHLERARLQAKRLINKLKGYDIPAINTRITKLNPLEYKDDIFVDLEGCPVCHSAVVHMDPAVPKNGKFTCAICGTKGCVEHHGGKLTYTWDDDSVAHNRLAQEHDAKLIHDYVSAHAPTDAPKISVADFPILTQQNDPAPTKPRVLALVAGPEGGTSELLARRSLEEATKDGKYEGAMIRLTDCNIHFCAGCLLCKVNVRYRGGIDECVIKDDDLWVVDKIYEADGVIISWDGVNGFTYGNVLALVQRFGYRTREAAQAGHSPRPYGAMVSSFDDQVQNVSYPISQVSRFFNGGPCVNLEYFPHVATVGSNILADKSAMGKAAAIGAAVKKAMDKILLDPDFTVLVKKHAGMCPACGMSIIELHRDMSVACAFCDAQGTFQRRFGENVIVWDEYDLTHNRKTPYGRKLHFKHINFSQAEDNNVLLNPKIHADLLAPYAAYGKIVKPGK